MKNLFESIFGISWRTSLAGWINGLLIIAADIMIAYNAGEFTGLNGMGIAFAILIIISGHLQKDKPVTGGAIAATPEAKTRATEEKVA